MRIGNLYSVGHANEAECPRCGKTYRRTDDWVYKAMVGNKCLQYFCSWSCLQAARAAYEDSKKKVEIVRKEKRKNLPRYVTAKEKEDICKMYTDGWSAMEISEETGRSVFSVQAAIKEKFNIYISPVRRRVAG